ncbi:hypothetical protein ABPG75_007011 [Micractinium tetrahymenae]
MQRPEARKKYALCARGLLRPRTDVLIANSRSPNSTGIPGGYHQDGRDLALRPLSCIHGKNGGTHGKMWVDNLMYHKTQPGGMHFFTISAAYAGAFQHQLWLHAFVDGTRVASEMGRGDTLATDIFYQIRASGAAFRGLDALSPQLPGWMSEDAMAEAVLREKRKQRRQLVLGVSALLQRRRRRLGYQMRGRQRRQAARLPPALCAPGTAAPVPRCWAAT